MPAMATVHRGAASQPQGSETALYPVRRMLRPDVGARVHLGAMKADPGWLVDALTWVNQYAAGLGFLATLATAVIAVVAITKSSADSRARSQPQVLAEFREAKDAETTIDLVVRNAGQTAARNLAVTFNPPLEIPELATGWATPILVDRYANVISVLGPGQQMRNIWWSGELRNGANELVNHEPTPDAIEVRVRYRGIGRRWITDSFPLHVDSIKNTTYSVSSNSPRALAKQRTEHLQKIAAAVQAIARNK